MIVAIKIVFMSVLLKQIINQSFATQGIAVELVRDLSHDLLILYRLKLDKAIEYMSGQSNSNYLYDYLWLNVFWQKEDCVCLNKRLSSPALVMGLTS